MNGETQDKEVVQGEQEAVRNWKGETIQEAKEKEWRKETKFEPKQAPRTPNLKPVIECIDNFYRNCGYAILPYDKKVALATAIHEQIRKSGLYE